MKSKDDKLWQDLDALLNALGTDLQWLEKLLATDDSQTWRRSYCRALFAMIEAIAEWMKRYTIYFYYPGQLSDEEKKDLEKRAGALLGIFAALDLYTNLAGAVTPFKKNSKEWVALQTAVRIRNRVTHPKCASDVEISNSDLQHLHEAGSGLVFCIPLHFQLFLAFTIFTRENVTQQVRWNSAWCHIQISNIVCLS